MCYWISSMVLNINVIIMEVIKIGKNKENVTIMIPFSIADTIKIEDGDQVNIKREGDSIFIYKLWEMDVEDGYNVCKKHNGNGVIVD